MIQSSYLRSAIAILFMLGCYCAVHGLPFAHNAADRSSFQPMKVHSTHLPNLVQVNEAVLSGGLPEGELAFQELQALGVKTIVSVDGMTPKVEMARKYSMRYVHLPHGYDGIPESRVKELAKAVSDLESPIYIHCHHGQHRSPAAAGVACVSAGMMTSDDAVFVLKLAGTNPNYKGLHRVVRDAKPLDSAALESLQVEFKEVQQIPPMAEAMVRLNHAMDNLDSLAQATWTAPQKHPDLDPGHEALLIRELYTELLRTKGVKARPDNFRSWLENSAALASELESTITAWQESGASEKPLARLGELKSRIKSDCKACHNTYRDVPQ